jgi:hypothetical protein
MLLSDTRPGFVGSRQRGCEEKLMHRLYLPSRCIY